MTSTAVNCPGCDEVERVARAALDAGLRGGSAFTPGSSVWTPEAADGLDRWYVQRPNAGSGSFMQKLKTQLAEASPASIQLCAELLYLNVLPLDNVSFKTKRARVATVLSWMPEPVSIPEDFSAALNGKIFSGGIGFNTTLYRQLWYLVAFVQTWWSLDQGARDEALVDPWAWGRVVDSVKVKGGRAPGQRRELKYLAFPATFLPIVSVDHLVALRAAYVSLLPGPPGDLDRDVLLIWQKLQEQSPWQPVDLYQDPWKSTWKPKAKVIPGRHAWLVRSSGDEQGRTVQGWLIERILDLEADKLRELPAGSSLARVREAVGSDYSAVEYVRQAELAHGFHAVLSLMGPGDVVATTVGESLHLGIVSDDALSFSFRGRVGTPIGS